MRLLYGNFVGEQNKGVLSYNNVLEAHNLVGNIKNLMQYANVLGYKYILWNGRVYLADGTLTVYTREDIR
jgi:hypothetical protein